MLRFYSMNPHLILASTSPYRAELLGRLSWKFETQKPDFDEESAKSWAPSLPAARAEFLALGKAESVLKIAPANSVVIGGDQLVSFHGQILGKPHSTERAHDQLLAMAGDWHELHTSIAVLTQTRKKVWTHLTRIKFRSLSSEQIKQYVQMDLPLDCAGAYKFEKHGVLLVEKIECSDFSAIQGLPLIELASTLIDFGFTPFKSI